MDPCFPSSPSPSTRNDDHEIPAQPSSRNSGRRRWKRAGSVVFLTGLLLLCPSVSASAPLVVGASASVSAVERASSPVGVAVETASSGAGGGNVVVQLGGYVRDSFVRFKDGIGLLYSNHGRCKEIRAKQAEHRKAVQAVLTSQGLQKKEIARQLREVNGGITYEEFDFLVKGKADRGKVTQLGFMMCFAPRFLPYAFWFFPDMLPSPFTPDVQTGPGAVETKWQALSRQRSHAIIKTLLDIEQAAFVAPAISKLNPFGRGKTMREMERMGRMGTAAAAVLSTRGASSSEGAEVVMDVLRDEVFTKDVPSTKTTQLTTVPKSIMRGLGQTIEGRPATLFDSITPNFLNRAKVLGHIKKIADADEFLVKEEVDIGTLGNDLLTEACSDRLIGGLDRTVEEMREGLARWLDLAVTKPAAEVKEKGLHFNSNLARTALMCYYALDGVRDSRAASYLPRLLYQGQLQCSGSQQEAEEDDSASEPSRSTKKRRQTKRSLK